MPQDQLRELNTELANQVRQLKDKLAEEERKRTMVEQKYVGLKEKYNDLLGKFDQSE